MGGEVISKASANGLYLHIKIWNILQKRSQKRLRFPAKTIDVNLSIILTTAVFMLYFNTMLVFFPTISDQIYISIAWLHVKT